MNNVYLRAFEADDYKTTIKWRKDDIIWNLLGGPKYFVSELYEKKWIEEAILSGKDVKLAICLTENNRHIGNVYMTNINLINQTCESHILIGEKDCWGKGYATEALKLAIEYMFYERNINRIQAKVIEENSASKKLHEKIGYKEEGILRKSIYKNGIFHNQYIMAILKDDYNK